MKKMAKQLCKVLLFFVLLVQTFAYSGLDVNGGQLNYAQAAAVSDYGLPAKTDEGVILHAWNWSFDAIRSRLPEIAAAGYKSIQTSPIQGTKENTMNGSSWWVLYQPINFSIGNAQLGSREQFRLLCEEAERYGINIIVDVVANHTANAGGGSLQYTPAYNVDPWLRNNSNFWHEARGVDNWNDRWQVTQWGIGLPDLNTANQQLQTSIIAFLNDAIALGADGFRFDAAKHIELPSDPYGASNFWTNVLGSLNNRSNLYIYGEVLQGGADAFAQYANYMDVTASYYGNNIRHAVGFNSSKNVNLAKDFNAAGVAPSRLVTWVESHDTYANDSNESTYMNEWQLKMGWAMVASRAQTVSLFFNRPAGNGKFAASLGNAGNDLWKDPDVVAVNQFHNAMAGEGEYVRNQGNEILLVERGTKGITIINLGGDAYIDQPTNLASGTYSNKATGGGSFTVAGGRITGNIGGGKIAVLYEQQQPETPDPNAAIVVHYYKPAAWGTPNIYYYDDSTAPVKEGAAWPGTAMTNQGNGWYSYTIKGWDRARVIFNSNGQQTPAAQQPGYLLANNAWIKDGTVSYTAPEEQEEEANVTFHVQNATTMLGQNIYLVGDIAELGSWNPQQAVGPGTTTNYPTWSFTVSLPVGETIQFKAIKKDSSNHVMWESGSNRSYTVSASNPSVSFSFRH
ncbi:alpha-amylase [Paenibacillus montaniterrae]|uniref:Alpha-amylase n=1 Tax=Paenibacillus montaniterrae TaxID=429341 RepID=A0A920CXN1_9BACL|nr:carbohydrate-binding module family 20 domain-containing protein [Paenibacillus montaniterrae]GIP15234.1 alpha-amylase [Paenibacillus montaniterrae]